MVKELPVNVIKRKIDTNCSPSEALDSFLNYLGAELECTRIYLFKKNEFRHYDCVVEWYTDATYPKKDLLQDLNPAICAPYYSYFRRGEMLMVRNIEDLKHTDSKLYEILLPQELNSFMAGQLVFDGKDLGFFGIDNPNPEKFDELSLVVELSSYYAAALLYAQEFPRSI